MTDPRITAFVGYLADTYQKEPQSIPAFMSWVSMLATQEMALRQYGKTAEATPSTPPKGQSK